MGVNARRRYDARRKEKRQVGYASREEFTAARDEFRMTARAQRTCQAPDCPTPTAPWMAHHVVYEQELRRRGLPIWDGRNAMRLCNDCHSKHHHTEPLPQSILSPANIEYAIEIMGDSYIDYFNRRYLPKCPI